MSVPPYSDISAVHDSPVMAVGNEVPDVHGRRSSGLESIFYRYKRIRRRFFHGRGILFSGSAGGQLMP